jgi:hypothetical protein
MGYNDQGVQEKNQKKSSDRKMLHTGWNLVERIPKNNFQLIRNAVIHLDVQHIPTFHELPMRRLWTFLLHVSKGNSQDTSFERRPLLAAAQRKIPRRTLRNILEAVHLSTGQFI